MLYTIFTIGVAVLCAAVGAWMLFRSYATDADGKQLVCDDVLHPRLWMLIAFLAAFAVHSLSSLSVVHAEGIEIYATQPLSTLYIVYVVLTMFFTFSCGRKHYKRLALWLQMLQLPVMLLFINMLMLSSGNYRPLFHLSELATFRTSAPLVFYGRMMLMTLLVVMWLFAIALCIEAWLYSKRVKDGGGDLSDSSLQRFERMLLAAWNVLLLTKILTLASPVTPPYFICNILILCALCATVVYFLKLLRLIIMRRSSSFRYAIIESRVAQLLDMEHGGITPWGIHVDVNPFYEQGNPSLEDIAFAIGVEREPLSEYVHQYLQTSVVSWSSEMRLRHCGERIKNTDQQVKEIALTCGYNDLATFSRAFKRLYGVSPSEYRKIETGN